jgi:poly(glycerol-phosphate) alpha-glucosyltransferase
MAGWDQDGHQLELENIVADLGIGGSVHFVGFQDEAAKMRVYHDADAFILPSFSEGLPMTVLEAWAHGLPVIITPECNLPEGFAAGAAIRVKANAADVARGLGILFSMTDEERNDMGLRGRQLVAERFSWSRTAAEIHAVYEWILSGGAPPSCVITD